MTRHLFIDFNDKFIGGFVAKESMKGNQDYFKVKYNSGTSLLGLIKPNKTDKQYHRDHLIDFSVENKEIAGQVDVITIGFDPTKPNMLDELRDKFDVKNEGLRSRNKALEIENASLRTKIGELTSSTASAVASSKKIVGNTRQHDPLSQNNGFNNGGLPRPNSFGSDLNL
jgi:hypothetical protein